MISPEFTLEGRPFVNRMGIRAPDFDAGIVVPFPARGRPQGSRNRIAWKKMAVGDSVFIEGKCTAEGRIIIQTPRLNHGYSFAVRKAPGGVRIWRTL